MALAICSKDGTASLNPMSFTSQHANAVMDRLRYQRASGRFCDVLIIVKDQKFNAHRMVLAASSPYFDAILRHNKIVKEKITVNCQNPMVFELLLNYIYSGNVVIDRSVVTELLRLANNLLIVKLKNFCAEYLERYIDVANCLAVQALAIKYNLSSLLKRSSEFFDSNLNGCLLENLDLLAYDFNQIQELLYNPKYKDTIRPDVYLNLIVRWIDYNLPERESYYKKLIKKCSFKQVTLARLERILDYNPFFVRSEISLYITLQEMHNVGIPMAKYEVQYRNLVKKYCQDNITLSTPDYFNATNNSNLNGPTEQLLDSINFCNETNVDNDLHREIDYITSGAALCADYLNATVQNQSSKSINLQNLNNISTVDFNKQQTKNIENSSVNLQQTEQLALPPLKIKINVSNALRAGLTNSNNNIQGTDLAHKKKALFGLNHYRKKQKILLRRRGRPPKLKNSKEGQNSLNFNEEPESCFFEFDNDNIVGVFDEEEDINPEILSTSKIFQENDTTKTQIYQTQEEQSETSRNKEYRCDSCIFKGQSEEQVKRHFALTHSKNICYICNICQFQCKWNRQFYEHMRHHFPGPLFHCDSCPYTTERINVLLTHRLTHTNDKPFKCPDCEFCCRNKSNLVAHYRLHSGEKPFQCPECHKCFAIRTTFEQHVATHSDERPFVCDECEFTTKYQSHLISHRRIHTGDLFRCELENCDYSSPKKSQLAAHLRTHLAVRSHQCRTCNRSFIEKSHLVRHERIHLADKPFKCGSCNYASSRRDKLKEHILKHHNLTGNSSTTGNSTTDSMQLYRRRYRRARQIAHLKAQAKLTLPDSSNFFRPIQTSDLIRNESQQEQFSQILQQQTQFLSAIQQQGQRSGSKSVMEMPDVEISSLSSVSSVPSLITMEGLIQQKQTQNQQRQQQHIVQQQHLLEQMQQNERFSQNQQQQLRPQDVMESNDVRNNVNEGFAQQQNLILSNRPCSASLPTKDSYPETSSISPSCYSLHDFHQSHSHQIGHLRHVSSVTPDTDLSTPGPHLENLRNPHSVSNLFANNASNTGHFNSHQLSIEDNQMCAVATGFNETTTISDIGCNGNATNLSTIEDTVQRPMSLPNYGELNQQQFGHQQHEPQSQLQAHQLAQHYNLMGLNGQFFQESQQQHTTNIGQNQQHSHWS